MQKKKISPLFKLICFILRLIYKKPEFIGTENLPDEPCVIVGNHTQMNGPIIGELYFPGSHSTWCAGEMMHLREVPKYAYDDFWSFKPKWCRPFFRLLSYLIAPLSVLLFNNAATVPVYHDTRIITTYRTAMDELCAGRSQIIFPEKNERYNNVIYAFQDKFIDLARFYFKRTGKALKFVPVYIAPTLGKTVVGVPTVFDPEAPIGAERERIRRYLADAITGLACSLPEHTVVPYRNIPKKLYPKNIPLEVYADEEAGR